MGERYTITVEHPGPHDAATLALRLALKRLLRDHGLRCVDLHPADRPVAEAIQRQRELDRQAVDIPITPRACGPLPEAKA